MNKKYIILIIALLMISVIFIVMFKNNIIQVETVENSEENVVYYVPEAEITDEQLKMAKVKLFFEDEKGNLIAEEREINIKELVKNPYKTIINLLIKGTKKENTKSLIPEGTRLLDVKKVEECLEINFSKEFINNCKNDKNTQEKIVKSIFFTLTES